MARVGGAGAAGHRVVVTAIAAERRRVCRPDVLVLASGLVRRRKEALAQARPCENTEQSSNDKTLRKDKGTVTYCVTVNKAVVVWREYKVVLLHSPWGSLTRDHTMKQRVADTSRALQKSGQEREN